MSSSTSSSRDEWKVVVAVVLLVAASDIALRIFRFRLSNDAAHIAQIPRINRELLECDSPRVLFLGNSMTRCGIDTEAFCQKASERGVDHLMCRKVFPDDTVVLNWYYYLRASFDGVRNPPDVIVISFARDHLSDQVDPRLRKLGGDQCVLATLPEALADMPGFDCQVDLLLSYLMVSHAEQEAIKSRVLDRFVPDYRNQVQTMNDRLGQADADEPGHAPKEPGHAPKETYERLNRLCAMLRRNGILGVFVAIPYQYSYDIDPSLPQVVRDAGMVFVDGRHVEGLADEHFRDEAHMLDKGATIFSAYLADQLVPVLNGLPGVGVQVASDKPFEQEANSIVMPPRR